MGWAHSRSKHCRLSLYVTFKKNWGQLSGWFLFSEQQWCKCFHVTKLCLEQIYLDAVTKMWLSTLQSEVQTWTPQKCQFVQTPPNFECSFFDWPKVYRCEWQQLFSQKVLQILKNSSSIFTFLSNLFHLRSKQYFGRTPLHSMVGKPHGKNKCGL